MKWAKKDEMFDFAENDAFPKVMNRKRGQTEHYLKMIFLEGFKAGYNRAYRKYVRDAKSHFKEEKE